MTTEEKLRTIAENEPLVYQAGYSKGFGEGADSIYKDAVLHTEQNLTTAQQAQARENIGAVSQDELDTALEELNPVKTDIAVLNARLDSVGKSLTIVDERLDSVESDLSNMVETEGSPDTVTWDGYIRGQAVANSADNENLRWVHVSDVSLIMDDITDDGFSYKYLSNNNLREVNLDLSAIKESAPGVLSFGEGSIVSVQEEAVGNVVPVNLGFGGIYNVVFPKAGLYFDALVNSAYVVRSFTIHNYTGFEIEKINPKLISDVNNRLSSVFTGNDTLEWYENEAAIKVGSYYKVSDATPTLEDFAAGCLYYCYDSEFGSESKNITFVDKSGVLAGTMDTIIVVPESAVGNSVSVGGSDLAFLEKGIYVQSSFSVSDGFITIPGYNGFEDVHLKRKLFSGVVGVDKQYLTKAQQAQARANIGAVSQSEIDTALAGLNPVKTVNGIAPDENRNIEVAVVNDYYSTTREELAVTFGREVDNPGDITSESVWDLYDALMAKYPDRVQKNEIHNNDGSFTNYEYVISTGEYNTEGAFTEYYGDEDIKKPKYLILSGIHGYEKSAILSAYRFIRDVLEGHNVPAQFREGCAIHILPVGNPYGLDNCTRNNENDVDINRNFSWNWVQGGEDEGKWSGYSAASEKETQAIANWLVANQGAEMFFDCHTTLANPNEVVWFIGLDNSEEYERSKRIALRGIGRVIPFWRDIIGYAEETVYTISLSLDCAGHAISYASEVVGIPSLAIELSGLQNEIMPDGVDAYNAPITPETVSAGAEVIGNALIEFYEQSFTKEVNECMEAIDGKLDALLFQVNSGFRVETGVYTVEEDVDDGSAIVEFPCKGVKILIFTSDANTREEILATTSGIWIVGFVGQALAEMPFLSKTFIRRAGYVSRMNDGKLENVGAVLEDTDNGVKSSLVGLKAGTYNWTAYYWNE